MLDHLASKSLFSVAIAAGLALAGLTAPPARADMQANLGPLADKADLGQDGAWTAEDSGGWFVLTNADAPGAVRYYWEEVAPDIGANYTVSVNLVTQSQASDPAMAGILFNYKAGDNYLGVTIGSDGGGYLIIRQPSGFNIQRSPKIEARNDGTDMIVATVSGTHVRFDVNGVKFLELDNENGFSRALGIVAVGQGTVGFTGFKAAPQP